MILKLLLLTTVITQVTSQSLDCNFDGGTICNWSNSVDDDFDWNTGSSIRVDGFHSIARTITGSGEFAYAQGRFRPSAAPNARAILTSPEISGLTVPASLSFSYWKTAIPPNLQVCTQDVDTLPWRCLDTIGGAGPQEWVGRVVTIPANPLTFKIAFIASNFNSAIDILGIDDVRLRVVEGQSDIIRPNLPLPPIYFANTVQPPNLPVFAPELSNGLKQTRNTDAAPPTGVTGACPAIACEFNLNTCRWHVMKGSGNSWRLKNDESQFAGIDGDVSGRRNYVYVAGSARVGDLTALQSAAFVTGHDSILCVHVYLSSQTRGRISIWRQRQGDHSINQGVETDNNFATNIVQLQSSTQLAARGDLLWQTVGWNSLGGVGWNKINIGISADSFPSTIIVMVDGLEDDIFVGIDDIKLVDKQQGEEVGCAYDFLPLADNLESRRLSALQTIAESESQGQNQGLSQSASQSQNQNVQQSQFQGQLPSADLRRSDHRADNLVEKSPRIIRILPTVSQSQSPRAEVRYHTVVKQPGSGVQANLVNREIFPSQATRQTSLTSRQAAWNKALEPDTSMSQAEYNKVQLKLWQDKIGASNVQGGADKSVNRVEDKNTPVQWREPVVVNTQQEEQGRQQQFNQLPQNNFQQNPNQPQQHSARNILQQHILNRQFNQQNQTQVQHNQFIPQTQNQLPQSLLAQQNSNLPPLNQNFPLNQNLPQLNQNLLRQTQNQFNQQPNVGNAALNTPQNAINPVNSISTNTAVDKKSKLIWPNIIARTPDQQKLLTKLQQTLANGGKITQQEAVQAYTYFASQIPPGQLQSLWKQAISG